MRTFFLIAFLLLSGISIAKPKPNHAVIHQIVETRKGHRSCWGVVIYLGKSSFNKSIAADQLSVVEAKHNHELKNMMTWHVDKSNRKLFITLKKGSGDFGSGNRVTVKLKGSAFAEPPNKTISLSITTDIH